METKKLILTAALLAVVSIYLALDKTNSLYFVPPHLPGSRDNLHKAEVIQVPGANGPESLAFDTSGGGPYAGVVDGRVLKWHQHNRSWIDFAVTTLNRDECKSQFAPEMEHICGRPLGLKFDPTNGDLYIADAYFGLHVVGRGGGLATPVVSEDEGKSLLFTNDMDIDDQNGVIYFTDTSINFHRRDFMPTILTVDRTGRLMKYEKSSKEVSVLLDGLAFANGVALSKDHSFVLVAETTTCRIQRLWLSGANAGKSEVFVELPGFPDNVRRNPKGEFWVAMNAKRNTFSDWLVSNPWAGKVLLKLGLSSKRLHCMFVGCKPHAIAMKLSETGEVLELLEDSEGKSLRFISEVEEKDGKLWIGSVMVPYIGIYNLQR